MKTKAKTKPVRKRRIYKIGRKPTKGIDPLRAYGGGFRASKCASSPGTPSIDIWPVKDGGFAPDGSLMTGNKLFGYDSEADFLASAASLEFSGDPRVAGQADDPGTMHKAIVIPTGAGKTRSWSNVIVVDEAHHGQKMKSARG